MTRRRRMWWALHSVILFCVVFPSWPGSTGEWCAHWLAKIGIMIIYLLPVIDEATHTWTVLISAMWLFAPGTLTSSRLVREKTSWNGTLNFSCFSFCGLAALLIMLLPVKWLLSFFILVLLILSFFLLEWFHKVQIKISQTPTLWTPFNHKLKYSASKENVA